MNENSPPRDLHSSTPHKPRLLFVGEGPQDIGRDDEPGGALTGFLHAVLCGPSDPVENHDLKFEIGGIRIWTTLQLPKMRKKRQSFNAAIELAADGERARAAMVLAATLGLDGVVILRDCERTGNIALGETLRQARDAYAAREPAPAARPALAIGTPPRCHETWLLADREAVRQVLDQEGTYHFSDDPEERPHCDTLKQHLANHSERLHRGTADVRRMLSFRARPSELSKRCPRCYRPFIEDVETELRSRFELEGTPQEPSGPKKTRKGKR